MFEVMHKHVNKRLLCGNTTVPRLNTWCLMLCTPSMHSPANVANNAACQSCITPRKQYVNCFALQATTAAAHTKDEI
jgi:hypothetical protein